MNRTIISFLIILLTPLYQSADEAEAMYLSLDQLINTPISSSASLTPSTFREHPTSTTLITRDMIDQSGARNLSELLEIYVPSYQYQSLTTSSVSGFRGLMRRFVIVVNGKLTSVPRISTGLSERFSSTLGDIESIEVIRGPGTAILGPGSVSGVISIKTYTPETFQDKTEVTYKTGIIEEFNTLELRLGHTFSPDIKMFLYAGIDDYKGVNADDAPYYASRTSNSAGLYADQSYSKANDYKGAYRDHPRYRLHLQLDIGNLTTWIRYNKTGLVGVNAYSTIAFLGESEDHETAAQQLIWNTEYTHELADNLTTKWTFNYTFDDFLFRVPSFTFNRNFLRSSRMDWYQGKWEVFWSPHFNHDLALGLEYNRFHSGLESPWADEPPQISGLGSAEDWYSHNTAIFGEYQYRYSTNAIFFLGGRIDNHSDMESQFSPKVGATFHLTQTDTIKLIYNRAIRRFPESELRSIDLAEQDPEPEVTDNYEIIYEKKLNENSQISLTNYFYRTKLQGLTPSFASQPIGTLETFGTELSYHYKTPDWEAIFSHAFTELIDFELNENPATNFVTPYPYGGSKDFLNWSPHQTKLYLAHHVNPKLTLSSSAVIYWGFPGNESAHDLNPLADGDDDPFKENIYINLGLTYKWNKNLKIRAHAINIMGWIDDRYNKRNLYNTNTSRINVYRKEAAALTFALEYTF